MQQISYHQYSIKFVSTLILAAKVVRPFIFCANLSWFNEGLNWKFDKVLKNQFWYVHPILAIVDWLCCLHVYRTVAVYFSAYLFDYFLTAFLLLCTSREESYLFQLFNIVYISPHFKSPLCFVASGICVAR